MDIAAQHLFLILGEYGLIGLILLLTLLYQNYKSNKRFEDLPVDDKHPLFFSEIGKVFKYEPCRLCNRRHVSWRINYPHIYILTALIISVDLYYREQTDAVMPTTPMTPDPAKEAE